MHGLYETGSAATRAKGAQGKTSRGGPKGRSFTACDCYALLACTFRDDASTLINFEGQPGSIKPPLFLICFKIWRNVI